MYRKRCITGLLVGFFATMTLAPASSIAQGACVAVWETDSVTTHERAELQARGQLFSPDCRQACAQAAANALTSYERAAIQATGQRMTGVSIAQEAWLAHAEMQALGQRFLDIQAFACGGGKTAPA